jgi:hypothetical protein
MRHARGLPAPYVCRYAQHAHQATPHLCLRLVVLWLSCCCRLLVGAVLGVCTLLCVACGCCVGGCSSTQVGVVAGSGCSLTVSSGSGLTVGSRLLLVAGLLLLVGCCSCGSSCLLLAAASIACWCSSHAIVVIASTALCCWVLSPVVMLVPPPAEKTTKHACMVAGMC